MYGHLATATGWTFLEIDRLTLWDISDLFDYWQDYPPTHILVAAYLNSGKKRSPISSTIPATNWAELAQAIVFAGGSTNKKLPQVYKR